MGRHGCLDDHSTLSTSDFQSRRGCQPLSPGSEDDKTAVEPASSSKRLHCTYSQPWQWGQEHCRQKSHPDQD